MAEIEKELSTLAENVKTFTEKAAKVETVETSVNEVKETVNQIKEWQLKKDEADKLNQEALDKIIAEGQKKQTVTGSQKSFDEALKDAILEKSDLIAKMSRKEIGRETQFSINLDFNTKAVGDVSISNYTGGTRGLTALRPGIITNPNRKVHLRDIVPNGTVGAGTEYVFMKENGAGEGSIAPTAEGATKPQFDLDLIEASVKIETIAGWMRVTRKAMNNIQGFASFLQMRLPQLMLNVEDAQILNGDGVSPNLKGIQTAGNFTAASGAATVNIEQLVQAIAQLEALDRTANGIVLATADYYDLLLNKAAGSGEYDLPGVVTVDGNGVLRILGIAVVHTTAQTVGTFLVGDFENGVQLLFQEGMRIEFFEQDGTNVRENKVTVRIEETVALPIYGATYFVKGTF